MDAFTDTIRCVTFGQLHSCLPEMGSRAVKLGRSNVRECALDCFQFGIGADWDDCFVYNSVGGMSDFQRGRDALFKQIWTIGVPNHELQEPKDINVRPV